MFFFFVLVLKRVTKIQSSQFACDLHQDFLEIQVLEGLCSSLFMNQSFCSVGFHTNGVCCFWTAQVVACPFVPRKVRYVFVSKRV